MSKKNNSESWHKFEWIRAGESGGPREGYGSDVFDKMSGEERLAAEKLLQEDFDNGAPFAAQGLAWLLGERCLTSPPYSGYKYDESQLIDIYGALLTSDDGEKYSGMIIEMFPSLSDRNKQKAAGVLLSGFGLSDVDAAKRLIVGEKNGSVRHQLARALFASIRKGFNDFNRDLSVLYGKIKRAEAESELDELVGELVEYARIN